MNNAHTTGYYARWIARFILLYILFGVLFVLGTMAVSGSILADATSEPGLVPTTAGLFIIALVDLAVIAALILTSRWSGWKLAIRLSLAWYGAVTVMTQVETWYFLTSITAGPELVVRLFLMGIPTAFLFIPAAVWILGKGTSDPDASAEAGRAPGMPTGQWIWKLTLLAVVYLVLYWGAGYYIAWQNPELRAFYGEPGDAMPFLVHTANTIRQDPLLFPFQCVRALVWILCALPVIRGSRVGPWRTALLVGLLFSLPQNVGHILENPLMPVASVRLSHMVETATSTFLFGMIVVWLLHREHRSIRDLAGVRRAQ